MKFLNSKKRSVVLGTGIVVLLIAGHTALAAPLQFTTNPFVTNITASSAVINWVTDVPADSTVWYTANPPGWQAQAPNTSSTMHAYDLAGVPGTFQQWAVGNNGVITHTSNGTSWSEQNSGTAQSLFGIDALTANQVWAVGNGGTIIFYNGSNWSAQTSGVTNPLTSVKAFAANNVWAVGYGGTIIHYNGLSWSTVVSPTSNILLSISGAGPNDIWAVGYGGTMIHYDGSTWQTIPTSPTSLRISGIATPTNSTAWAAGDNGLILKGTGSGLAMSWSIVNSNTTKNLIDIDAFDASHVWAVGESGTVTSTFDGTAWTAAAISTNELDGVSVGDSTNIWTGGLNNALYHYGINFTNSLYSSAPSSSATLSPLSQNTTYYYIVEASDGVNTIVSPLGTFRTLAPDTVPPPPPSLSGTTDCTTGGVFFNNLSWTTVTDPSPNASGVSGYTLLVGSTPLVSNQLVTSYSHSSLTPGTTYNYVVRARDNAGNTSVDSNVVSLITKSKDFSLASNSGAQSVRAGDPATFDLSLASLCGLSEAVTLTVSGLPAGTSAAFAPNNFIPAAGGTPDVMTVTTQRTATPGTYPLTITATSASKTHTVGATLTITPPADYTVTVAPTSRTVVAGNAANYTVTITPLNGFNDTVTLSTTGLPSGAAASFTPGASVAVSGSAVNVQMNITTTVTTPAGSHTLTISGADTGGVGPKTTTATLVVNPAPDFTISATPATQTVAAGDTASYTITLTSLNSLTGTAQVSASIGTGPTNTTYSPDLLAGASPLFLGANSTANLTFVISPAQNASTGTYAYTISATLQGITRTTTLTLVIGTPKDFTISVNPTSLTVSQGASKTAIVTIATTNGLNANVALTISGLPAAANATWSANPVNPSGSSVTSTLTVNANTAAQGTYTVTLTGTYGSLTHSTSLTLIIVDTTPPIITFTNVVPGVTDATVNWTTNESATEGIYYWVGTDTSTTAYVERLAFSTTHSFMLTNLNPQTLYTFQIVAFDAAGNQGTDIERTFTTLALPDTIDPVVSITSPANQTPALVVNGTLQITGTATDNVGVQAVSIFQKDSTGTSVKIVPDPTYTAAAGTFVLNWDTLAVTNGQYELTATATDAAGNVGTSSPVTIEIYNDTSAPVITNITTSTTNTTALIEWDTIGDQSTSVIDYGLENQNGTYSYTNQVVTDDSGDQYTEHHMVTLRNLTPFKRYHYQITSCDPTGNCGH